MGAQAILSNAGPPATKTQELTETKGVLKQNVWLNTFNRNNVTQVGPTTHFFTKAPITAKYFPQRAYISAYKATQTDLLSLH